jgi:Large polyvalent protein-associated domain 7
MASQKRTPKARMELQDPTLQAAEPNGVTPGSAPPDRARKARDEAATFENTIRARRARIRGTPREDAKPKHPEEPSTVPGSDPRAVPEHISARYVKVGSEYHFPNGDLAFADRGARLSTRLENTEVIRDLVTIAKERGWTEIAISGTERFRKEAWQQARLSGLAVRGYRPSDLERAQLARLIARERDREPNTPSTEYSAASERSATQVPAGEEAVRADARHAVQAPDRVHAGRLLGHGTANYRHDARADLSYFVKIDTPDGERTLWGKDLERALGQSLSRAKPGDEVVVRQLGAKPVTVVRPVRDEEGRIVERTQVQTHLNRWSVERADFLNQRAEVAQIVRDPSIDAKTAAAKRPELAGTYTELHAAKLIAEELFAHPADRERFITRVREAIADEIERGEPLSAPRVRTRTKDLSQYPTRTPDRAQERVLS